MREVLGEKASVLLDFALVNIGRAAKAVREASAARSPKVARREWERAAEQLRKAQAELARAELAALERTRSASAADRAPPGRAA